MNVGILIDIGKMLGNGGRDGDGQRFAANQLHQLERVLQRAASRTHARHGDADKPLHRITRAGEGIGRGEQRQRRIQAAAHAQHGALCADALHASE